MKSFYSTKDVIELSGLTRGMVNYLAREGIVTPQKVPEPRKGLPRRYLFGDIVCMKMIGTLHKQGASVQKMRLAIQKRKPFFRKLSPSTRIDCFFVTDGVSIFDVSDRDHPIDVTENEQMVFSFMIDIREIHSSVVRLLNRSDRFPHSDQKARATK